MSSKQQVVPGETGEVSRRTALAGVSGGAALAALSLLGMRTGVAAQSDDSTPESGAGGNYMVIRQYLLAEDADVAEMLRLIQDGFVPVIREVDGFVAYYFLHDEEAGTVASISIFADRAGSEASTEAAASWIEAENFDGNYQGPPTVTVGTLGISEVAS